MTFHLKITFFAMLLMMELAGCDSQRAKRDVGSWTGEYEGVPVEITIIQGAVPDKNAPDSLHIQVGTRSYFFNGLFEADAFQAAQAVGLSRSGPRSYILVTKAPNGDLLGEELAEAGLPKNLIFHPKGKKN